MNDVGVDHSFVEFEDAATAARAIAMMNDRELDGRRINVREDRDAGARVFVGNVRACHRTTSTTFASALMCGTVWCDGGANREW